jgi:hypothetical protein
LPPEKKFFVAYWYDEQWPTIERIGYKDGKIYQDLDGESDLFQLHSKEKLIRMMRYWCELPEIPNEVD